MEFGDVIQSRLFEGKCYRVILQQVAHKSRRWVWRVYREPTGGRGAICHGSAVNLEKRSTRQRWRSISWAVGSRRRYHDHHRSHHALSRGELAAHGFIFLKLPRRGGVEPFGPFTMAARSVPTIAYTFGSLAPAAGALLASILDGGSVEPDLPVLAYCCIVRSRRSPPASGSQRALQVTYRH
jgi:hypothetical protein